MKNVILFSGGKESVACLDGLKTDQNYLLYISYGNAAKDKEIYSLQYYAKKYGCPYKVVSAEDLLSVSDSIKYGQDCGNSQVAVRNIIFISIAINIAESIGYDNVVLGATSDSFMPDGNSGKLKSFIESMGAFTKVKIRLPAGELNFFQVIDYLLDNNVDISNLVFCENPDEDGNCGYCNKCIDVKAAINVVGVSEKYTTFVEKVF